MVKRIFYFLLVLFCILAVLIGPIDRTPLKEKSFYSDMMNELDTLELQDNEATDTLRVGWSKVSITPDYSMPMAGYSPRDSFKQVHDTLYARILSINNGSKQVYLISMDLLLVPPAIKNNIAERLKDKHKDAFVYYSATHTHNGLGGWENSVGGEFVVGDYDSRWVESVTTNMLAHMEKASNSMINCKVSYLQADAEEFVGNRLARDAGKKDGKIRGLKFERLDGTKAILFTYGAHATSISSSSRSLSGDYPSEVVNELSRQGWNFSVFMGGMVGSHTLINVEGANFDLTKNAGVALAQKIQTSTETVVGSTLQIKTKHVLVELGPSQLRILDNWKLRDWVFRLLFGRLKAEITYLKLGNVLLLGTPCDFSGELAVNNKLDSLASAKNEHLIITSFNGNYIGYITEDKHYDAFSDREEVRAMNWVGPYYGEYFTDIIKRLIDK